MPNTTTNLGLNVWLENDVVNFEDFNENFEKIDDLIMCIESGTITSGYSGGVSGNATWRYKKYSDGTVEMSTKLEFTNVKCDGGSAAPYYSGTSVVNFPFSMSSVYDVQMHLASNTIGWISDVTERSVLNNVSFRVMGMEYEDTYIYKQVYINVKGVISNG